VSESVYSPVDIISMNHLQRVGASAYGVAALLLIFPLLDVLQAVWPPRLGEVSWRVIAAGLLSRVLVTPVLGLLLAFAAALILSQPRVLRTLAVVNALVAVLAAAGLAIFGLDALQVRNQVGMDARGSYDLGLLLSFLKYGVVLLVLALMAWSEWKSAASLGRTSGRRSRHTPLVLRQTPRRTESDTQPLIADDADR
jgi:hypothetical protein